MTVIRDPEDPTGVRIKIVDHKEYVFLCRLTGELLIGKRWMTGWWYISDEYWGHAISNDSLLTKCECLGLL
jgi:hypothetical protein